MLAGAQGEQSISAGQGAFFCDALDLSILQTVHYTTLIDIYKRGLSPVMTWCRWCYLCHTLQHFITKPSFDPDPFIVSISITLLNETEHFLEYNTFIVIVTMRIIVPHQASKKIENKT